MALSNEMSASKNPADAAENTFGRINSSSLICCYRPREPITRIRVGGLMVKSPACRMTLRPK